MDFNSRRSKVPSVREPSPPSILVKARLVGAMMGLSFVLGCSSSHTTLGDGSDNPNNGRLKGSYVYTLGGRYSGVTNSFCSYCANGSFQRQGTFVADGKGHITGGSDQFVQGPTPSTQGVTGTYAIADDGTGIMLLNAGTAQLELAFVIVSDSSITWIEFDSFASGAGGARSQDTTALTSTPSGTFVFHVHSSRPDGGSQGSVSTVGQLTISNGSVNGREDVMRGGVFSSLTVTGSLTAPDASGAGILSLTDSQGFDSIFSYYVVDSSTLNLLETDLDNGQTRSGTGRAEIQTNTTFDNGSLQGGFVFSSSGAAQNTAFSVVAVGAFTADGGGNIVNGSYDSVLNGTPIANAMLTGTYSVSPGGRATISLTTQAAAVPSIQQVAWMVNASHGFFLVNFPGRAEDGALNQQLSPSFSEASMNGPFSFSMFGGDALSPSQVDRTGVATFDGKSLTFTNYFVNRGGSKSQTQFPAVPYTVSSNGRVSASVNGFTNALVMYMVSNTSGSLILEDTNTEVSGGMAQQSP